MHVTKTILLLCSILILNQVRSQSPDDSIPVMKVLDINPRTFRLHDSIITLSGICKPLKITYGSPGTTNSKKPFSGPVLKIHGNIQYDFVYRSYTDTPFLQHDFAQHTVRTLFNVMYKNRLPVKVIVQHRNSNSPYFRDMTDVTVQFSHRDYTELLKKDIEKEAFRVFELSDPLNLKSLDAAARLTLNKINGLENWLNSPGRLQEIVTEKEYRIRKAAGVKSYNQYHMPDLPVDFDLSENSEYYSESQLQQLLQDRFTHRLNRQEDSLIKILDSLYLDKKSRQADSVQSSRSSRIEAVKKELSDLKEKMVREKQQLRKIQKQFSDSLSRIRREISRLHNPASIRAYARKRNLSTQSLPDGWKLLSAIRTISIGRSWIDYSDLTVRNISLTGINAELNPGHFYFAAAAGKINYRFRDFILNHDHNPSRQRLYMLRAGIGNPEGNNLIFTWYDGRRNLLSSFNAPNTVLNPERILGMAAETRIKLGDNHIISAGFAKSSYHTTGNANGNGATLFERAKNFRDHTNEAFSIRINSVWPGMGTRLSGYYRKSGANFQSFNLQPVNSEQESYQFRLQQQLWKRKLVLDAAVRKNDFSNPFINPGISNKTVFKSIQASLRIPHYPFLSIGYAPTTQLTVMDNQQLTENQYNTLNAVMSYSYRFRKLAMASHAMYLKFYNHSADTGFIYYNASSFTLNQFVYLRKWQWQSGLTRTVQENLRITTLEISVQYQAGKIFFLTGGLKTSRVRNSTSCWGATAGINMSLRKLGLIQFNYDKSYLPGVSRNLVPVQTGRVSFYRAF